MMSSSSIPSTASSPSKTSQNLPPTAVNANNPKSNQQSIPTQQQTQTTQLPQIQVTTTSTPTKKISTPLNGKIPIQQSNQKQMGIPLPPSPARNIQSNAAINAMLLNPANLHMAYMAAISKMTKLTNIMPKSPNIPAVSPIKSNTSQGTTSVGAASFIKPLASPPIFPLRPIQPSTKLTQSPQEKKPTVSDSIGLQPKPVVQSSSALHDSPTIKKRRANEAGESIDTSDGLQSAVYNLESKRKVRVESVSKGCSCKKTGCLKRYCDCFQNGVRCTDACRCIGCKNYDGSEELNKLLEKGVNVNQRHFLRQGYTVSPSRKQLSTHESSIQLNNNKLLYRQAFARLVNIETISDMCNKLLLTAYNEEKAFARRWNDQYNTKAQIETTPPTVQETTKQQDNKLPESPKTPQKQSTIKQTAASPDTLSLLCEEDDALEAASVSVPFNPSSFKKMQKGNLSQKGYDFMLQAALEKAVLIHFRDHLKKLIQNATNSVSEIKQAM